MKAFFREICPPLLWRWLRQFAFFGARKSDWQRVPVAQQATAFQPHANGLRGWDVARVAAAERSRLAAFQQAIVAPAPVSAVHESEAVAGDSPWMHGLWMTWAYVLTKAADGKAAPVRILDWGGGLGHSYFAARSLFPSLMLDYTVKELPHMAAEGKTHVPEIRFVASLSELASESFDLVVASGSLHYSENWRAQLVELIGRTRDWLYLTRLPTTNANSFVFVQHVPGLGYDTEYAGWVIHVDELISAAKDAGLRLERRFVVDESAPIAGLEPAPYRGFLFRKSSS